MQPSLALSAGAFSSRHQIIAAPCGFSEQWRVTLPGSSFPHQNFVITAKPDRQFSGKLRPALPSAQIAFPRGEILASIR
jgi:hypothetical protein